MIIDSSDLPTGRYNMFDLNGIGSLLYELAFYEIGSEALVDSLSETLRKQLPDQIRILSDCKFSDDSMIDLEADCMYYLTMAIDAV